MKRSKKAVVSQPNYALSIPSVLLFCQFIFNVFTIFKTGVFDNQALGLLLSSSDGFETVILFLFMLVLKRKKVA